MKQRVTIDDVARIAKVSKQTVSRAINNKGDISPQTKSQILAIVKELGYRPSRMAQAMNTQRSYMVGFVIPDITNPFFSEVVRGVQDAAMAANYSVLLCNTDTDPDQEKAALEMMATQGVDGIIAFGFNGPEKEMARFADTFHPIVYINSPYQHKNVSRIMVKNDYGAQLAVDHFVESGHTHIGMISVNNEAQNAYTRREIGLRHAIEQHNLPFSDSNIVHTSPQLMGGYDGVKQLLAQQPEITAVFCYNDLIGLGAIRAANDLGKRIPQDLAIIGFDDVQLSRMNTPSLSSISVDKHALGSLALNRILAMIDAPEKTFPDQPVDVELIHRESTKHPKSL